MIELTCEIPSDLAQPLEDFFCELPHSPWILFNAPPPAPISLSGYFDSENEAMDAWADLRKIFPTLQPNPTCISLADNDWKEAYKANLHPWHYDTLHWVPEWHRIDYPVSPPDAAAIVYFDAGLAFGTGDHPTTRLCAIRLVEFLKTRPAPQDTRVIDAGCGSGILSLSAAKLGCSKVFGFDCDPDAVRVSIANRTANALPEHNPTFLLTNIEDGLRTGGPADIILANIISDVLCAHATKLLNALAPGGTLVLSGILAHEKDAVRTLFSAKAASLWGAPPANIDSRTLGEWADITLTRPA
ncbi:MAG: 50S ribosomal protein L11 methyltransferase [Puniceicoccales bacterium]|jgi:ribosomal protein L11 methyltransferase|nr:50S ribosomal protein L11 methyltransferase [Puniceicoccales bacterium]